MEQYLNLVKDILKTGERKENRTGIDTYLVSGRIFKHDMKKGFPILTTKRVPFQLVKSELEFFIKGLTDKRWLQERKNKIWDEWCNPKKVPYAHDEESKNRMMQENDLGPIYGFQWRHFGAEYKGPDADYSGQGIDQLATLVETLKNNPNDRRMIVNSWNPAQLSQMALPPCHYGFQVTTSEGKVNLLWNQRSVDTMLGLPFNIASYGLLLHLLAKESGLEEGILTGFLADVHIYENHFEGAKEQLSRKPGELPRIDTESFSSIFNWEFTDSKLVGYNPQLKIDFKIAV
ncbi:MAG: thymidylate synthase [archaeon]|nr:thymidylate synthase [archaeon]